MYVIHNFTSDLRENAFPVRCKDRQIDAVRGNNVCSENHTQHENALCGNNAEFFKYRRIWYMYLPQGFNG